MATNVVYYWAANQPAWFTVAELDMNLECNRSWNNILVDCKTLGSNYDSVQYSLRHTSLAWAWSFVWRLFVVVCISVYTCSRTIGRWLCQQLKIDTASHATVLYFAERNSWHQCRWLLVLYWLILSRQSVVLLRSRSNKWLWVKTW